MQRTTVGQKMEYNNTGHENVVISIIQCPSKKKLRTCLLQKTTFCLDYGVRLLWYCLNNLRLKILSIGLKTGLCGGQFMCEISLLLDTECPMNLGIVVLEYARAIREEKIYLMG